MVLKVCSRKYGGCVRQQSSVAPDVCDNVPVYLVWLRYTVDQVSRTRFPELSLQNAKTQQRTNVWCETGREQSRQDVWPYALSHTQLAS